MSYILGISFDYHDSAVFVLKDGKPLFFSREERYSKFKHDSHFPHLVLNDCLKVLALKPSDIDKVVFYENTELKFTRVLSTAFVHFPFSVKEFVSSLKTWLGLKLWTRDRIAKEIGVEEEKISMVEHHKTHAASSFLTSGFEDAVAVIIDAVGEWDTASVWKCEYINGKPHFGKLSSLKFPMSYGLLYSTFTSFLGLKPNNEECSVMALAAFGKPIYQDKINQIVKRDKKGMVSGLDMSYFNFMKYFEKPFTTKFESLFGNARKQSEKMPFDIWEEKNLNDREQFFADIAASIQCFLEEEVLKMIEHCFELNISRNLCLAGGVFLNCKLNQAIIQKSSFEKVFVPIDPGDGGSCIGAAMLFDDKIKRGGDYYPGLGKPIGEFDDSYLENFEYSGFKLKSIALSEDELIKKVVNDLMEGKIVGLSRGPAEIGPRALGFRSILVRPDRVDLAQKLSTQIKKRAGYRPYAISIAEDEAERILDFNGANFSTMKYMQVTVPVKDEYQTKVAGAVHVDRTTRPHFCTESENPFYYRLLKSFGKEFGVGAFLNTSFNERGFPIVNNEVDSISMFLRTKLDILVLGDKYYYKEKIERD